MLFLFFFFRLANKMWILVFNVIFVTFQTHFALSSQPPSNIPYIILEVESEVSNFTLLWGKFLESQFHRLGLLLERHSSLWGTDFLFSVFSEKSSKLMRFSKNPPIIKAFTVLLNHGAWFCPVTSDILYFMEFFKILIQYY
jgi:hypothetical protein